MKIVILVFCIFCVLYFTLTNSNKIPLLGSVCVCVCVCVYVCMCIYVCVYIHPRTHAYTCHIFLLYTLTWNVINGRY